MNSYSLIKHLGADMQTIFILNGKRVSRNRYELIQDQGHMFGRVYNMSTKCRDFGDGSFRRTNYTSVDLP